jgi:hypothetical protein
VKTKEFLGAIENAWALAQKIREPPNSGLFCPAEMYDGKALRHFSSLCDTFIHCDVAFNPDGMDNSLLQMMADAVLNGLCGRTWKMLQLSVSLA